MRVKAALAGAAMLLGGCSLLGTPTADVGECVDIDVDATVVSEITGFECSTEHDAEVYAKEDVTLDGAFDLAAVEEAAANICLDSFESFVGVDYYSSSLDFFMVYPQSDGWDSGDRQVLCMAYTPGDTGSVVRMTGTLEGAES